MTEQELTQSARLAKGMRAYLIMGIILSLLIFPVIFSIILKPVVGLIVAGIWGTVSVIFVVKYKNKLKAVKEEIRKEDLAAQQAQAAQAGQQQQASPVRRAQQTAPVRQQPQTATARQQQSVTDRQQAIVDGVEKLLENPVVKVAATYAVGRAAIETVKKTGIGSGIVNGSNSTKYKETIINDSVKRQLPGGGVRIPVRRKDKGNFGAPLYLIKMPDRSQTLITPASRVVARYDPVKGATYTGDGKKIGNGNQLDTLYKEI